MRDTGRIILGLIIFLVIMTFPIWYNFVQGVASVQDPEIATKDVPGKDRCVKSAQYMKAYHMDLLNQWRDEAVRQEERIFVADDGRKFNKSLSSTCMDCHQNKELFCDRCHNVMAVKPYCWDCHLEPKQMNVTASSIQNSASSIENPEPLNP